MNMPVKTVLPTVAAVFLSAAAVAEVVNVPANSTVTIPLAKPVQYEIYRFVTKKVGDGSDVWLQFAELALYDAQGNGKAFDRYKREVDSEGRLLISWDPKGMALLIR